ncbi:RNA methyltransferase [Archangium primigenium]|nr:RNA methyltransferase [Archangium primigenium]
MPVQMANVQQREHVFVATLPGLEPALVMEAEARGLSPQRVEGGVELVGPSGLHQEANLHLRTASRVWLRVGRFTAPDAGALTKGLAALPLGAVGEGRGAPRLAVSLHGARLPGPDAVLAAAARAWGVPAVERAGALDEEAAGEGLTLLVRVEGTQCTVSAETSGEALHRRGYRQEVSRAPLRETLAAGILLLAGYDGAAPLVDPMCGSGTFLIEGAWMAQRRAPGLARAFAFERFPGFVAAEWEARRARAQAEVLSAPPEGPRGYDLNAGSLGTARRNARRAGVTLTLERQDARTLQAPPGAPGWVVANPPYGKRVGEGEDLPGLYRALGRTLRESFAGWHAALLVPDEPALVRALELPGARSLPLRNGGLRCRLLLRAPP